jgi:hypothetical protein
MNSAHRAILVSRCRCCASRWKFALLSGVLVVAFALAGCKSRSLSQYIAPRVEGRVLDAKTRQPIRGVAVQRMDSGAEVAPGEIPKGGQAMQQTPSVRTGNDGTFALASERNLELFSRGRWYSVAISFKHTGYASFLTNYTPANATPTTKGEPLVQAGDILLVPNVR